jgi:PPOX class probable F420-dependent enzyme
MLAPMDSALDPDECRRRFAAAERVVLATIGDHGAPHLVPVTFALVTADPEADDGADLIVVTVDHKPKRTTELQRLRNVRQRPRVSFLADHYSSDWDQLWWVRADASAVVLESDEQAASAIDALVRRYEQYRRQRPVGPVVSAVVDRWVGWSAQLRSSGE